MSEWKHGILQKYVTLITKGTTPTSIGRSFRESGVNYIKAECIDESGTLVSNRLAYIDLDTHEALRRSQLEKGDILFSIAGVLGRVMIIGAKTLPANINQALALIRIPSDAEIDRTYLRYYLVGSDVRNQITRINVQAAQANFSLGDVNRLVISFPTSLIEQKKIADILSTVDEVIEQTEAAIEKYQAIKAGMMQDLFTRGIDTKTGKLRPTIEEAPELYKESELGWIPKEWEIVQIGDFAKIKGGKRMPAGKEFSDALTPYPYLRVTDMQNGSIDQSDLKYVPVEIEPLIRSYKISVDDVYVTIAGTLGLFGTIPVNLDQAQLTENAARITEFDKFEYDRDFIKHQCNSVIVQGQVIREIGVGGGVPKLALYRIAKFLFLKPAINEQQAIVDRIQVIEHKLSDESVALTKYKQIKQGLMADLLTGKVRVNLNENKVENG
jgi:type I restriction enzyme S subunit